MIKDPQLIFLGIRIFEIIGVASLDIYAQTEELLDVIQSRTCGFCLVRSGGSGIHFLRNRNPRRRA